MATIADELNAIAVEHGYTGAAPKTIAGAIDALADTLAGTDVEERRTIAGAVKALAPYIGSGGGGSLGDGHRVACARGKQLRAYATRPDDILTAQPNIAFTTDGDMGGCMLPAGVYACVGATSNATVYAGGDEIESEIVETEYGGTTYYTICFVMPDADVNVVLAS